MTKRAVGIQASPRWPAAASLGAALTFALALGPSALARGGLAGVAVAALVAAFVGVPLASAEWSAPRSDDDPWLRASHAVGELWTALLLGALAAPWVAAHGARGALVAAVAWLGIAACGRASRIAAPVVGVVALLAAIGVGAHAATVGVPWTLLAPHWAAWPSWVSLAVAGGVLLPVAGFGQWSSVRAPTPGHRGLPWTVAGAGLLAAVGLAVAHGVAWEVAPAGITLPYVELARLLALAAAICAVTARSGPGRRAAVQAAAGLLATLWFAGPAADALPLWWSSLLPLGPAFVALVLAARSERRWVGLFAGGALLVGGGLAWPGLPSDPSAAAAIACVPVVAVWWAGTRALVWRPA